MQGPFALGAHLVPSQRKAHAMSLPQSLHVVRLWKKLVPRRVVLVCLQAVRGIGSLGMSGVGWASDGIVGSVCLVSERSGVGWASEFGFVGWARMGSSCWARMGLS